MNFIKIIMQPKIEIKKYSSRPEIVQIEIQPTRILLPLFDMYSDLEAFKEVEDEYIRLVEIAYKKAVLDYVNDKYDKLCGRPR